MTFGVATIIRPGATALVGVRGSKGDTGVPGTNGSPGAQGPAVFTPITAWVSGLTYSPATATSPASFVSINGGSYACATLHTSGVFAADLAAGLWEAVGTKGTTGAPGTAGSTWYEGSGLPSSLIGINGDFFLRTDTNDVLLKVSSAWSVIGNLKGAPGPAGPGSGNVLSPATGSTKPGQEVVFGADETHITGAVRTPRGDATYTILATDSTVAINAALTAPRVFTLPAASALAGGAQILIADEFGGVSATNTVTIARAGTDTINGGSSVVLASAFSYLVLESDGSSKWTVVDSTALKPSNNLSDVPSPSVALTNLGGVASINALAELAALGVLAQALARQNIGAISRGRALALAIAN